MAQRRLWWLTVYDPTTGCATNVVGVVGVQGPSRWLSWLPHHPDAWMWHDRLGPTADIIAVQPDAWAAVTDGVTLGLVEMANPPDAADLAGAVETAVDDALAADITRARVG